MVSLGLLFCITMVFILVGNQGNCLNEKNIRNMKDNIYIYVSFFSVKMVTLVTDQYSYLFYYQIKTIQVW